MPADGAQEEAAVVPLRQLGDFLAEMEHGAHRGNLLHQALDEFLRAADGQRRDIVDRLVGVQLRALAARVLQGVDDVALDAEQAEFEDLEQAGRAGADDQGIGLDGGRRGAGNGQGGNLRQNSANSSGSRPHQQMTPLAGVGQGLPQRLRNIRLERLAQLRQILILDAHQGRWAGQAAG